MKTNIHGQPFTDAEKSEIRDLSARAQASIDKHQAAAHAIGRATGDAHMKAAGRTEWNDSDYLAAAAARDAAQTPPPAQPAPAPTLMLVMTIPEAERQIEIQAENIPAAALVLLQEIHQEFSAINPDVLEALADLIRQNEFDGVEYPESAFCDMSCPEDNFSLSVHPIPPDPVSIVAECMANTPKEHPEHAEIVANARRILEARETVKEGNFCEVNPGEWQETGPGWFAGKTVEEIRKQFPGIRFAENAGPVREA